MSAVVVMRRTCCYFVMDVVVGALEHVIPSVMDWVGRCHVAVGSAWAVDPDPDPAGADKHVNLVNVQKFLPVRRKLKPKAVHRWIWKERQMRLACHYRDYLPNQQHIYLQSHLRAQIRVFYWVWKRRAQNKQIVWGKPKHLREWKESQNNQICRIEGLLSHSKSRVYWSRLKRKSSRKQTRKRCRASGVVDCHHLLHNEIVHAQMIKSVPVSVHIDAQMLGFCIDQISESWSRGLFEVYHFFPGLWNV